MHWIEQPILEQLGQDAGEELLPQLVTIFIEDGQKNLAELGQALRRRDAEQLLLLAHTLKSVCATWRMVCHEEAQRLEQACRQSNWSQMEQLVAALQQSLPATSRPCWRRWPSPPRAEPCFLLCADWLRHQ